MRPWELLRSTEVEKVGSIPKIIHQTWKNNEVPYKWRGSPKFWKKFHPDWTWVLWTDKDIFDYIKLEHPEFVQVFLEFPHGIQKADAIRYFVLHDFGGVYSDLDLLPKRNIEEYFSNGEKLYFLFSPNMNVFTNFLMASAPGEEIWRIIWKRLYDPQLPNWAVGKHLEVMYSTGPAMVSDVVMNYPHTVGFLPRKVFAPIDVTGEYGVDVGKTAGVIMLPGQSWNSFDSTVYNFFYTHRVKFIVLSAILSIILISLAVKWGINRFLRRVNKNEPIVQTGVKRSITIGPGSRYREGGEKLSPAREQPGPK